MRRYPPYRESGDRDGRRLAHFLVGFVIGAFFVRFIETLGAWMR